MRVHSSLPSVPLLCRMRERTRFADRKPVCRHAFTLIELVISTSLMAMILGAAYVCLRAGLTSQSLIDDRQEVFQSARVAMGLLSADLRSACSLSKKFDFVGMHRMMGEIRADNLDFATHNYTQIGRASC